MRPEKYIKYERTENKDSRSPRPETFDIILDSPSKIPEGYRRHNIADFILTNEKGLYEPDEKVIFQVAEHYF